MILGLLDKSKGLRFCNEKIPQIHIFLIKSLDNLKVRVFCSAFSDQAYEMGGLIVHGAKTSMCYFEKLSYDLSFKVIGVRFVDPELIRRLILLFT